MAKGRIKRKGDLEAEKDLKIEENLKSNKEKNSSIKCAPDDQTVERMDD